MCIAVEGRVSIISITSWALSIGVLGNAHGIINLKQGVLADIFYINCFDMNKVKIWVFQVTVSLFKALFSGEFGHCTFFHHY